MNATTLAPNVGMLLLAVMTFVWWLVGAVADARAQVRDWRRRDDQALSDAFGDYGLYRHVGSPPSHAAVR